MQHLGTLKQLASTASQLADLARSSQTYHFTTALDVTFYLHIEHAEVVIARRDAPDIDVVAMLQAPFGWRIETDQDEVGVYMVVHRRPVVGGLSGAVLHIAVPQAAHVTIKAVDARVSVDGVRGVVEIPPDMTRFEAK